MFLLTGVFQTESTDLAEEIEMFAQHMSLESGMSLCEMGSANGAVISRLGQKVMPGGKLYATAPLEAELAATRTAVADAGLGGVATYKATKLPQPSF